VEESSLEVKELRDSLAEAERERDEAVQQRKDVGESAKAGQRESAARIVEFSQKNAKLLADVTQLRGDEEEEDEDWRIGGGYIM
jgi:F0F1-type ATP synthase membrane subunit b/b'